MPGRGAKRNKGAAEGETPLVQPPDARAADKERKLSGRVELGPMSVDLPPEWRFYPMEDRLACRPMSGVGVLQIKPVPDTLPACPTHEMLMAAAKEASGYNLEGPGIDKAKEMIDGGQAGGESFRAGRDYVRVWYHRRPEGLVLAWFACPAKRIAERSVARLIGQSDRILASVRLPPTMDA
jgi:hypothetical protein